ncbi:MAG TPA: acyltransferase [Acidimicrobiales bacterium]|nr:acyltransferase [Acidimicrobiales bacterium]
MRTLTPERLRRGPWLLRYRYGQKWASDLRRLMITVTHRHCRVEFRGPVRLGPGFSLFIPDHGTLEVGSDVEFRRGFFCEIFGDGRVSIGDGSRFTSYALIQCTSTIDIGKRCMFGQSVLLVDGGHKFRDPTRNILDQGYDLRPVRIGDDAVLMAKTTCFADVGEGTVVAANSVVSRDLPARCLAVGAPAKPIEFFQAPGESSPSLEVERPPA